MSLFILDTDILSLAQHANPNVLAAIILARHAGHTVAITAVTIEEQTKGWLASFNAARDHAQRERASRGLSEAVPVWAQYAILPQTETSLNRFDALVALKLNVGKMDLRTASVALELGAAIVTRNTRDFARVPGLPNADWTVPPAPPTATAQPPPTSP